jgi:hypothetical protein
MGGSEIRGFFATLRRTSEMRGFFATLRMTSEMRGFFATLRMTSEIRGFFATLRMTRWVCTSTFGYAQNDKLEMGEYKQLRLRSGLQVWGGLIAGERSTSQDYA